MPAAYAVVIREKTRNAATLDEYKKILPAIFRESCHGWSRRANMQLVSDPAERILQPALAKGEDGIVKCSSRRIPGMNEAGAPASYPNPRIFSSNDRVRSSEQTRLMLWFLVSYMMRNGVTSGTAGSGVISEQGTKMGRSSILHVCLHGDNGMNDIDVGGYVTPLCEAVMGL